MNINRELKIFLENNFPQLSITSALFYNWHIGLRFNLQTDTKIDEEYFSEVTKRANALFKEIFQPSDSVFLIVIQHKYKRQRIRHGNYLFKQLSGLKKNYITYTKVKNLYGENDPGDIWNVATTKLISNQINYVKIFKAISNLDFPSRQPRVNGQIYFINVDKKIIFNMYDDRGVDIISSDKDLLRPLYKSYNNWLLEYDLEEMNKRFV